MALSNRSMSMAIGVIKPDQQQAGNPSRRATGRLCWCAPARQPEAERAHTAHPSASARGGRHTCAHRNALRIGAENIHVFRVGPSVGAARAILVHRLHPLGSIDSCTAAGASGIHAGTARCSQSSPCRAAHSRIAKGSCRRGCCRAVAAGGSNDASFCCGSLRFRCSSSSDSSSSGQKELPRQPEAVPHAAHRNGAGVPAVAVPCHVLPLEEAARLRSCGRVHGDDRLYAPRRQRRRQSRRSRA